jgi:ABC-type transporter MlaC component
VHFGFYWGSEIADPEKKLLGNGKQYRYIIITQKSDFPKTYIKRLVKEAYANSLAKVKDKTEIVKGTTTVRCSLAVKKRPGKTPGSKK